MRAKSLQLYSLPPLPVALWERQQQVCTPFQDQRPQHADSQRPATLRYQTRCDGVTGASSVADMAGLATESGRCDGEFTTATAAATFQGGFLRTSPRVIFHGGMVVGEDLAYVLPGRKESHEMRDSKDLSPLPVHFRPSDSLGGSRHAVARQPLPATV